MRIGISTSVIQRGKTGIAEYVFALLRALMSIAEEHEIVAYVLEEDLPFFEFARGRLRLVPVSERFRPPVRDILWHQTALPVLARRHRLDVLHVPSYRRLLWLQPCALVATVHDLAAFRVAKKYDQRRMFYGRVVARWLARRQHQVIAVSRNTAQDLQTLWHMPREQITVIHHGVDHERFNVADRVRGAAASRQYWGLDEPFFLYVARLEHPAKNHVRLINAFEAFKRESGSRWQLVLAGSDWHGSEAIHWAMRRCQVAGDIRCLGFVPEPLLPGLYQAANVFVYPSLYEGFGFPPLEAMACGCPVLSSTRGALGEIVGPAAATLDPESDLSLRAKLKELAGDPLERERLRAAGLQWSRSFDWRRAAKETIEVYARASSDWNRRAAGHAVRPLPTVAR